MSTTRDVLFVGTYGHVRALLKRTGEPVWTTSLPGCGYQIVTLLLEDGLLFAGSGGHLYALDPASGDLLWKDDMRGLGYGPMTLCTVLSGTSRGTVEGAFAAQQAAASSAATTSSTS